MPSSDSYLIVGGGLLGGHIVDLLLQRGEKHVAVFDLKPSSFDAQVKVYQGDIADPEAVAKAIKDVGTSMPTVLLSTRLFIDALLSQKSLVSSRPPQHSLGSGGSFTSKSTLRVRRMSLTKPKNTVCENSFGQARRV